MSSAHIWKFFRAGGFDQVRLDSGADFFNLSDLDQKLWVALSCPIAGSEFDPQTLALLDADGDGHVRAADLLAAIDWLSPRLKEREVLAQGALTLPLAAIDPTTDDGRRALASARRILANLGRPDDDAISVADAADTARIFGQTRFNGDGIITAASADDRELADCIADIGAGWGTRMDRSQQPGIDGEILAAFAADATALLEWQAQGDAVALPELADPLSAHAAFAAVRDKIDDFFTRCALAAFDPRAVDLLNGREADFEAFARDNLAHPGDAVASLPLAHASAGAALALAAGCNPAWAERLRAFDDQVVTPLLGARSSLSEADWRTLAARLAAFDAWRASRPQNPAAQLPAERVEALLAARPAIDALLALDLALSEEAAAVDEVAKLTRLVRDLARFANNFVAFRDFYTRAGKAIFQAGTLYFDGRSADLCIRVEDPVKHAALATLARMCLVYCECRRQDENGTGKMTIAAAFTAGDSDQIMVGRNGIFYDRKGRDWDATIVKVIDHPISLRQAFWSPYRKAARLISEQVHKFAAARAHAAETQAAVAIATGAAKAGGAPAAAPPAASAPSAFDVGKFAGIFAAIGLAIGAIGTAVAAVLTGFLGLRWWQMPLAIGGLLLLVSGPAVLLAFLKLRARTLGPLLDANGWAVNARARINLPFGTSLTQLARLPEGAERALTDPYADKRTPWGVYLGLGLLLGVATWLLVIFATR